MLDVYWIDYYVIIDRPQGLGFELGWVEVGLELGLGLGPGPLQLKLLMFGLNGLMSKVSWFGRRISRGPGPNPNPTQPQPLISKIAKSQILTVHIFDLRNNPSIYIAITN